MKRMNGSCMAMALTVLAFVVAQTLAQDATPPGPGDEWQQEDWTTAPAPRRNRPMRFGRGMSGSGPMFGPADMQQRMQEMQGRFFDMQSQFQDMQRLAEESKNNAIRQNLGVNDQQWARIKPRIDRIERLKNEVNASIEPGSYGSSANVVTGGSNFGGGFSGGFTTFGGSSGPGQSWSRTETFGPGSARSTRSSGEPTQAETLCEELYNLIQAPGAPPAQIAQKVAALRQAKQRAASQLQRERTGLRAMVNPQQEAALIVMGYLD
ncbi:MAG: hypothetical protein JW993_16205 [Sedimentisphaerales bacterium]|nr:hypothetical protein [Sedimentisphaerales bacterium]